MDELLTHIGSLLITEMWSAAALHVLHAAKRVQSRQEGLALRRQLEPYFPQVTARGDWAAALTWTAYRSGDLLLLRQVLSGNRADILPAFRAYLALTEGRWAGALELAQTAWAAGEDRGVSGRVRASALAALARDGWQAAFGDAAAVSEGRDRGLLRLEWAYALSKAGEEGAARGMLAQATLDLRGDAWAFTLAQANLGIACLRLDDYVAAEVAFQAARRSGQSPEGRAHLSTALRGQAGLALRLGQLARAEYLYGLAVEKAETAEDEVEALRSGSALLRLRGRPDAALLALYSAARRLELPGDAPHALRADTALCQLLVGDDAGAARSVALARPAGQRDAWRRRVAAAELDRRAPGRSVASAARALGDLPLDQSWVTLEAQVFPELFAPLGVTGHLPPWTARVSADGPVRLDMSGGAVPLRAGRPEGSLLAYLVWHGGAVSAEKALEALDLPGGTPRARQQALSVAVRALRRALDWPGSVTSSGGLLVLSGDVQWGKLLLPPLERTDDFCEGRADPWVVEWRSQRQALQFPIIV